MVPINVMDSSRFDFPYLKTNEVRITRRALKEANPIPLQQESADWLKRAQLNLVTTPNLRCVTAFYFGETETEWVTCEPEADPVTANEMRGLLVSGILAAREGWLSSLQRTVRSDRAAMPKEKAIKLLDRIKRSDKVVVVLLFENALYVTGNAFDETTFCQAMLDYRQPKREAKKKGRLDFQPRPIQAQKELDQTGSIRVG